MRLRRQSSRRFNRVIIEQATVTANEFSEEEKSWSHYCIRWANVLPLRGEETFSAAQEQTVVSHKIDMAYDSKTKNITANMRVNFNNRLFDIESVINIGERNHTLELSCQEKSTDVDNGDR